MPKRLLSVLLLAALVPAVFGEVPSIKPSHGRPYFMPENKRKEILELVRAQPWARESYEALKAAARGKKPGTGDGFAAAFFYALEGDPADAATAEKWLLSIRGKPSHHRQRLDDPNYWKGGQTMQMSEIHYGTDPNHYVAFDWAYNGLSEAARKAVYQGLLDETQFRMKWLDTWRYTPNLEFKPLYMAAFGGLTLQDPDALKYLLGRIERHGSYFSMIDRMLLDGQAWHEAPTYPIHHTDLWCMGTMSFYGQLATGQDWFSARSASGASAKGLMDYYIDTAYPMETDAAGNRRIRVATYGDGATHSHGDLFLVHQAGKADQSGLSVSAGYLLLTHQALIACYRASGRDAAYAKFVSMIPDYKPDLWKHAPLPDTNTLAFPPAPSKVWPRFGLAMLRSIESPAYWTDPRAIAVFQLMTQGYGHDHGDKFSIMLHGAGKLLYPDFNAIQYENPAIGWTRNTVSHCTMMVDEEDTARAPCTVRHEFAPQVKFLATSADGVFDGVAQTRALLLSDRYLLDLFAASSKYPRVYDYLLHSLGKPQPVTSGFGPGVTASRRFWVLDNQQGLVTDQAWQLDFAVRDKDTDPKAPASMVRVTMAPGPNTAAVCGTWGSRLAEAAKRDMAELGMLVARRAGLRDTVFAAAHEPYYEGAKPSVATVAVVAHSESAIVVRVDGAGFTDYAAVEWKPREGGEPCALGSAGGQFGFRNYAWLRITTDGTAVSQGQWAHLRVPAQAAKTLDGQPARLEQGQLVIGQPLSIAAPQSKPLQAPFTFRLDPPLMRIDSAGTARLSITNQLAQTVSGSVELDLPTGLSLATQANFGPVAPGASAEVTISLRANTNSPRGMRRIPYRLRYAAGPNGAEQTTLHEALPSVVGPTLIFDYSSMDERRFRIFAPQYTAESLMRQGLLLKLTGPDGTVVLDDQPMFTFFEKDKELLHRRQGYGFTWPAKSPASITAHVEDRVRYRTDFLNDRVRVGVDPTWNLVKEVRFALPGLYTAPGGKPAWKRIIAVDEAGKESDVQPGPALRVAAAELELPGLPYSLAFEFNPPLAVDFDGTAMKFTFDGFSRDWWSFGFCPAGKLAEWRNPGAFVVPAQAKHVPAHGRPFFMPEQERTRLRQLIAAQEWAKADYARLQQAARKGDGYPAAFLYALDGDPACAPIAQKWLLGQFGKNSGKVNSARGALSNPDYFKGGMPHLGSVYYDTDFTGYAAFDWAYNGLEPAARQEISEGIVLAARYKMRCMDRWWQTPNLMFKPTSTVAVAGLATQDKEAIEWGFRRSGRTFDSADLTPGSHGGYFRVLNAMLKDGGVWHESTTYAISHQDLYCMTMVSRFLSLAEDKDWWRQQMNSAGSAAGLMDYYIDSAYPIERTGYGPGQIRIATYGDGATHAGGDLYLVNPAEGGLNATEALIASYQTSQGDPRLAPFMAMIPDYKPTLINHWPVPEKVAFPPAPSKVWPTYGLAMLRADESPAYWTNDSLAVFHIMGHGYSHDHRDKFAIVLHGAGRLLYPDHNTIQYENPYIGWTRNTIGHCTLMVDEKDTRNAPTTARHEFSPEVKFLASSASGIFEAVDQTRALLLTREYLLDLFQAGSPTPRTFDYLLHSFGKPQPAQPEQFKPSTALDNRYWLVSDLQAMNTDAPWTLDFVVTNAPGDRKVKFGPEWYDHKAAVRVTMAAEPKTLVTHGLTGIELAKQQKRAFDTLGMLIVRRADVRQTVFAATHEPYASEARPRITAVTKLAQTDSAILVRVDAADFTDYAAVAFGPQPAGTSEHVLTATGDSKTRVAFKNYGYVRVRKDGPAAARGGWTALSLPDVKETLTLNGQPTTAGVARGYLTFGTMPAGAQAAPAVVDCPFPITCTPDVIRLAREGRRTMTLTLKNTLPQAVSGSLAMNLPAGVTTDPAAPQFGPVQPGATVQVPIAFVTAKDAVRGKRLAPCRVSYRPAKDGPEVRTGALPLHIAVDPSLESVYQYPQKNVFLVSAPRYTLKLHMRHGLPLYLADDDGTVRLEDGELFTISNKDKPVLSAGTADGFTWPEEAPAGLVAHMGELRYCVKLTGDRVILSMDRDYTTFDPARITIPGKWISPEGAPTWTRIVAVDANGQEAEAKPGTELKISAAELAFPGAKWNLAFGFNPPQPVTFNGTELKFPIGSYSGDACSMGFCKPGELDAWRKGSSSK